MRQFETKGDWFLWIKGGMLARGQLMMSFMAQRGRKRDRNNYCLGTSGGSKNHNVICNQYLCDFLSWNQEFYCLDCHLKQFWRPSLQVRSDRLRMQWFISLLSVSVPYQFVQVNLRQLPAVVATSLSNLSCTAHRQEGGRRSQSFPVT